MFCFILHILLLMVLLTAEGTSSDEPCVTELNRGPGRQNAPCVTHSVIQIKPEGGFAADYSWQLNAIATFSLS